MSDIGIHTDRVKKTTNKHKHIGIVHREGGRAETGACQSTAFDLMPPRCARSVAASVEVSVEVVLLAEFVRERDAGDQLAPVALDRVDVEEHHQA